jgi:hypothetical protein
MARWREKNATGIERTDDLMRRIHATEKASQAQPGTLITVNDEPEPCGGSPEGADFLQPCRQAEDATARSAEPDST